MASVARSRLGRNEPRQEYQPRSFRLRSLPSNAEQAFGIMVECLLEETGKLRNAIPSYLELSCRGRDGLSNCSATTIPYVQHSRRKAFTEFGAP